MDGGSKAFPLYRLWTVDFWEAYQLAACTRRPFGTFREFRELFPKSPLGPEIDGKERRVTGVESRRCRNRAERARNGPDSAQVDIAAAIRRS